MVVNNNVNVAVDSDDILVTILHPHGEIETTLANWIERGPGGRPLLAPERVRRASTGEPLSLRTIPLRYRNNGWSRLLIRLRVLKDPWG